MTQDWICVHRVYSSSARDRKHLQASLQTLSIRHHHIWNSTTIYCTEDTCTSQIKICRAVGNLSHLMLCKFHEILYWWWSEKTLHCMNQRNNQHKNIISSLILLHSICESVFGHISQGGPAKLTWPCIIDLLWLIQYDNQDFSTTNLPSKSMRQKIKLWRLIFSWVKVMEWTPTIDIDMPPTYLAQSCLQTDMSWLSPHDTDLRLESCRMNWPAPGSSMIAASLAKV